MATLQITGPPCSLADCPPGLFVGSSGALGFRSEYGLTIGGTVTAYPEAFVLESGECWWGGATTHPERADQVVTPVRLTWEAP